MILQTFPQGGTVLQLPSYWSVHKSTDEVVFIFLTPAMGKLLLISAGARTKPLRDKANVLTSDMGRKLAKEVKAVSYQECSALTGEGLTRIFSSAVRAATQTRQTVTPWRKFKECSIV